MTPPASVNSAPNHVSIQPLTPEDLRKIDAYWRAAAAWLYLIEGLRPKLVAQVAVRPLQQLFHLRG